jgi:PPK2 family polyphosphate:nucleotide phosphotransferase
MGRNDLKKLVDRIRVEPGKKVDLDDYPTSMDDSREFSLKDLGLSKEGADELLAQSARDLVKTQDVFWADNRFAMLVILQGMDASGKDGIVKHVMSGLNPQGSQVTSFTTPTAEEADHDFLWRCVKALPDKGKIGIFNRSYYEEVLVVKVHPSFLDRQRLPDKKFDTAFWERRYHSINEFEWHLVRNGTKVIKMFLNVSKDEQRDRLMDRIEEPEKRWKFNPDDVEERALWPKYMEAYRDMLEATSTEHAPWYVLPADQKWLSRVLAASIVNREMQRLGLRYPPLSAEEMRRLQEARSRLLEK